MYHLDLDTYYLLTDEESEIFDAWLTVEFDGVYPQDLTAVWIRKSYTGKRLEFRRIINLFGTGDGTFMIPEYSEPEEQVFGQPLKNPWPLPDERMIELWEEGKRIKADWENRVP